MMNLKNRILKIAALLLSAGGFVWFLIPVSHRVLNVGNATGMALCALVFLIAVFSGKIRIKRKNSKGFHIFCRVVAVLFCIGIIWAAVLTGLMVYSAGGGRAKPPRDATVVVLGSKVSGTLPSADLAARINAASVYLKGNPQAKCIASGGRGAGELVTEASVIREYLIKDGIDESRVITEEKSRTTMENLKNSLDIIEENGLSRDLAIVTDEYHQFRAGRMAESLGAQPYAVCAQTPWYIFSACSMRELLALTKFLIFP